MLVVSVASVTVVALIVVRVVELQSPLSVKMALTLGLSEKERKGEKVQLLQNIFDLVSFSIYLVLSVLD